MDQAGVGAVHVRPTFFAEMLLLFGAQTMASEGRLYLPYGDERHAPVAAQDIARVVVAAELERPVTYVDLPIAAYGEAISAIAPPFLVAHLKAFVRQHRDAFLAGSAAVAGVR